MKINIVFPNEKQIEKAAKDYIESQEVHKMGDYLDHEDNFIAGAKWVINKLIS